MANSTSTPTTALPAASKGQEDMLLSTLASYLSATGAVNVAITMTVNGRRVELSLDDLRSPETTG